MIDKTTIEDMTYDQFKTWYEVFIDQKGGYQVYNGYYDAVISSKKTLRKFLGSFWLISDISVEDESNIDTEKATLIIEQLSPIINLPYNCPYSISDLTQPYLNTGSHSSIRVSKYLSTLVRGYCATGDILKASRLISQLGEVWAAGKITKSDWTVALSSNPQAFVLLGSYGIDSDSCFKQGSDNDIHKYVLGQSNNTYVVTIFDNNKDIAARAWGFADSEIKAFNLQNLYVRPKCSNANIHSVIRKFFQELLPGSEVSEGSSYTDFVYNNEYGNFSFLLPGGNTTLVCNQSEIKEEQYRCPHCSEWYNDTDDWSTIDGESVCSYCSENANYCDNCGHSTHADVTYVESTCEYICEYCLSSYPLCTDCHKHAPSDRLISTSNNNIVCPECLEESYVKEGCEYVPIPV